MAIVLSLVLLLCLGANQDSKQDEALAARHESVVAQWIQANVEGLAEAPDHESVSDWALTQDPAAKTYHFVHFREFPMARMPPKPLALRSVFSVDSKEAVTLYTKRQDLNRAFAKQGFSCSPAKVTELTLAWLKVSSFFSQDGFFKFVFEEKNVTKTTSDGKVVVTGFAPVEEKGGDKGRLTAALTFEQVGMGGLKLVSIKEDDTVQPGIRPICQCTLLLDSNPIVRKMAERDLLVMGEAARPYMLEQRAKASPELQREIDRVWERMRRGER